MLKISVQKTYNLTVILANTNFYKVIWTEPVLIALMN